MTNITLQQKVDDFQSYKLGLFNRVAPIPSWLIWWARFWRGYNDTAIHH